MAVYALDENLVFPLPQEAEHDGLLAFGGDLSPERLILAYMLGIFPWYSYPQPILWWSPDPRFVLYPDELKVSKSMRPILNQNRFHITYDQAFSSVIDNCKTAPRKGQNGTWITAEMREAYEELHRRGLAHSVEAWQEEKLVGGLYGVSLGRCFFGESMFSHASNASKAAFITLVRDLTGEGFDLIDCQVYTDHLASLGAKEIPREDFLHHLSKNEEKPTILGNWGEYFKRLKSD